MPAGLRISHDTWSLVRGLFELDEQPPPLQIKGIEAPMQTYLVHAALQRDAASVERGLQGLATPMVGRDAELQRLLTLRSQPDSLVAPLVPAAQPAGPAVPTCKPWRPRAARCRC